MYVMYMVINTHGATESKGTIWTLRQHPIKWDNMSRVVRSIAEMYRILRSKKTGEVEKGSMSQVLKGRLECTKGRSGKVMLGMDEEQQTIQLISLAKGTV